MNLYKFLLNTILERQKRKVNKEKSQWQLQQAKTPTKTCSVCNIEKIINQFYPRKPYCIDCTQLVLQKRKCAHLKKEQKEKIKEDKSQELKGKPCIFCGILTKLHYRDDKKYKHLCINCKEILDSIVARKTRRLESRLKKITEDYTELKEKLEDYKSNIKAIIKASKNA